MRTPARRLSALLETQLAWCLYTLFRFGGTLCSTFHTCPDTICGPWWCRPLVRQLDRKLSALLEMELAARTTTGRAMSACLNTLSW